MFRSWFNTPTTIDTKPLAAKHDMAVDTTARHQGEKLFNTITTSPTATATATTTTTPMTTTANAASTMTMMVSPKVQPTVKSTSVNVNMDDQPNIVPSTDSAVSSEFESEPLRSASISLSIELAKKTSYASLNSPSSVHTVASSKPIFMQKPDTITPQSSLPKYITSKHAQSQERPSSIASHSSNSLLQRMAHSPKAAPATFSTSVSANGKNNSHQDNNENSNTPAVIESLSRQINPPPPPPVQDLDELTEEDIHNVATNTTTPTVSMNTTDNEDDEEDEQENQQELQQEQQQKLDSSQSSTCENATQKPLMAAQEKGDQKVVVGFWTWLGFPPSDSDSTAVDTIATRGAVATAEKALGSTGEDTQQEEQQPLQQQEMEAVDQINTTTASSAAADLDALDQKTKTSSWSSFLFPSRPSSIHQQQPPQKPAVPANQTLEASTSTTTNTDTNTQAVLTADESASDANLRKVKSTSSLPSSPLSTTHTLRYSASISSFQQPPKKKNFVFPPFESQFLENDAAETNTIAASNASTTTSTQNNNNSSSNLITKAMDAINAILIPAPAPPAEEESTSNWIAKRMRAKFSNFVEDIKQYTSTKDPVQSAMLDKRIVVVGVHGWFPMKVSRARSV